MCFKIYMKVESYNFNNIKKTSTNKKNQQIKRVQAFKQDFAQISFLGMQSTALQITSAAKDVVTKADYNKATKYFAQELEKIHSDYIHLLNLKSFNLDKMNGIQYGLDVFKGLSMKQIAFLLDGLEAIITNRGCSNLCAHCYENAKPQQHLNLSKNSDWINSIDIEDFNNLTESLAQLKKRLKIPLFYWSKYHVHYPFKDADGMDIAIKDGKKILDFSHVNDKIFETTGLKGLFDTAGWIPHHKVQQQRAENLVKYFADDKNTHKIFNIYISINPFHMLNAKAIAYKDAGDIQMYEKYKELYVNRIANAIFTFTPVLNNPKFSFLLRAIPSSENVKPGYHYLALQSLIRNIVQAVKKLYEQDLQGANKYIYDQYQITNYITALNQKLTGINKIGATGRAEKLFSTSPTTIEKISSKRTSNLSSLKKELTDSDDFKKIIDVNGKVYLNDNYQTIPTELQLNFKNKDKKTVPFVNIVKDYKITKQMIENPYKKSIS